MKICEHDGCKKFASHMPVLCVPATGWMRGSHPPLAMYCGVSLCKFHANEFKVNPFDDGNEKLREVMELTCRASGKAPPDFRRAWMEYKRLDSPDVRKFLSMQSEGKVDADVKDQH